MRSASSGSGPAAHKEEGYKGSRGLSEPSGMVPPSIPAGLKGIVLGEVNWQILHCAGLA